MSATDHDRTPALLAELTLFLLRGGHREPAATVLGALRELRREEPATDLLRGLVAFAGGRYGVAESCYRELLSRHPDHDLGCAFLAETLVAQKRWRPAEELLAAVRRRRRDPAAVALAESLAEGLTSGLFHHAGGRR